MAEIRLIDRLMGLRNCLAALAAGLCVVIVISVVGPKCDLTAWTTRKIEPMSPAALMLALDTVVVAAVTALALGQEIRYTRADARPQTLPGDPR